MAGKLSADYLFMDGAARFHDLCYLIIRDRKMVEEEIQHSSFVSFDEGEWAEVDDTNWNAVAVCVVKQPAEKMVGIGEDGNVLAYVGGNAVEETIKPQPVVLRGIGVIDGFAYACGMKRQVYKRDGENSWVAMHATSPQEDENAGFEAIDGYGEGEIYAVGWNGEIWEWDGTKWTNHSSPTNLVLTSVCCANDGYVYVCGQHGTLMRGRHGVWDMIDLGDLTDDFWNLCWFDNQLYIATMLTLYTFTFDAGISPVDFGPDRPGSCYRLTHAEDVLWSIGADDVFSFDGTSWTRVD